MLSEAPERLAGSVPRSECRPQAPESIAIASGPPSDVDIGFQLANPVEQGDQDLAATCRRHPHWAHTCRYPRIWSVLLLKGVQHSFKCGLIHGYGLFRACEFDEDVSAGTFKNRAEHSIPWPGPRVRIHRSTHSRVSAGCLDFRDWNSVDCLLLHLCRLPALELALPAVDVLLDSASLPCPEKVDNAFRALFLAGRRLLSASVASLRSSSSQELSTSARQRIPPATPAWRAEIQAAVESRVQCSCMVDVDGMGPAFAPLSLVVPIHQAIARPRRAPGCLAFGFLAWSWSCRVA